MAALGGAVVRTVLRNIVWMMAAAVGMNLPAQAAAQDTPPPAAAPAPGTWLDPTKPPFLLRPFEKLYPLKNGCSVIDHANDTRAVEFWANRSWFGACWFGLAHGPGVAIWEGGSPKQRERYHFPYGFTLPYRHINGNYVPLSEYRIGYAKGSILDEGRQETV